MNSLISLARKNTIANALFKTFSLFQSNFSHGNLLKPNFIQQQQRTFSCLFQDLNKSLKSSRLNLLSPNLFVVPSCGMKVKGKLKLRCKDCYFARIDGRVMVLCSSYPRHKQMALVKREKYTWILTHCCQSKKRPY